MGEAIYAEPLTPEEIRWFYKDGVDKRWVEFCGYDSLRIEKIYQDRQDLLSKSNSETNNLPPAEKIVVRGGMYDVEIDNMKCVSIYWPGEYRVIIFFCIFVIFFYYNFTHSLYIAIHIYLLHITLIIFYYTLITLINVNMGQQLM